MKATFHFLYLVCAFGLFAIACNNASEQVAEAAEQIEEELNAVPGAIQDAFDTEPVAGANYGAGVAENALPVALPIFVQKLEAADSMQAVVKGRVADVCQKKGCWMTLEAGTEGQDPVNVRFKDYGFFMPKNLSGSEVVVEGMARKVITPVEDLQHYAEDAGKSAEEIAAITEPKEEVEFIATGVRVL